MIKGGKLVDTGWPYSVQTSLDCEVFTTNLLMVNILMMSPVNLASTKRCMKEALGTWELLDKHSHKLRTPPSYWLDPSRKPYQ